MEAIKMNHVVTLTLAPFLLLAACGYKPAPKPPGYDSVTTTQADGIPPILSQEQLEQLDQNQLRQRINQLQTTLKNTHGNRGVSDILTSQLQAARGRMDVIQSD